MDQLNIKVPSIPENIRIVESFIDNANELFSFNDDMYGNIMVSVIEAVNNAITHGNKNDKSKMVSLSLLLIEDKYLRFIVSDEGEGFDPSNLADPTAPENIELEGGRGIFLINSLCDKVEFKNEGKSIELTFNL